MKRYRTPTAKPGELKVSYGKAQFETVPDLLYTWGGNGASKSDGGMLSQFFEGFTYFDGRNLRQELEVRGYDIETLKFSIKRKET